MPFWSKKDHEKADRMAEAHLGSSLTRQEKIDLRQFRRGVEAGNRQFEAEMKEDKEHQSFLKRIGLG